MPAAPMRRRLLIAAFVLDGLCALAAPFVLTGVLVEDRYVEVAGVCVEQVDPGGQPSGGVAGRPVHGTLCE